MGIFELSVTWLSNNAQNKLKYVDVAQGIKANKKKSFKTYHIYLVWTFVSLPLLSSF